MNKFKVGDQVRCINVDHLSISMYKLRLHKIYTVTKIEYINETTYMGVKVDNMDYRYWHWRFELATPETEHPELNKLFYSTK